jgi:hypothetical protein
MNFPSRPRRRPPDPELVVAWNGTMAGAGTRTESTAPAPLAPERFSRYDVLATLRAGDADGLTMRAIADALGATIARVNSLLASLVLDGSIVVELTATKKRYGGQLRRYRVVAPPILDVGRARGAHVRAGVPPSTPHRKTKEHREQAVDRHRALPSCTSRDRTE